MSASNPLYSPALDAIWWFNSGWNSATFPGWTTALAGAASESQIGIRMDRIRSLTDLDGSLWWWPYAYGSMDSSSPVRGEAARKCGWGAAVYLCRFVNEILGISVDSPSRSVRFAPFTPWDSFSWRRAKIGWNTFDVSFDRNDREISATLRNRNARTYSATIVLTSEEDRVLTKARAIGATQTEESRSDIGGEKL